MLIRFLALHWFVGQSLMTHVLITCCMEEQRDDELAIYMSLNVFLCYISVTSQFFLLEFSHTWSNHAIEEGMKSNK